ncbi:MAG: phosphoribosylanthranilate isomerase [Desulfonatronovibrionaceae bacterium]
MKTRVKICGITREQDLLFCIQAGIDFAGFIFHPESRRYIRPEQVGALKGMEGGRVGVFVRHSLEEIKEAVDAARLDFIQLHGAQDTEFCRALPADKIIKVFWPEKYPSPEELQKDMRLFAPLCRYLLLDAGQGGGGHGRRIKTPYPEERDLLGRTFIAGGLGPDNIKQVLNQSPFAVDISSGVEKSPGIKDQTLVLELIRKVRTKKGLD